MPSLRAPTRSQVLNLAPLPMAKHSPENRPPRHETDLFLPEPESVLQIAKWRRRHAEVAIGCMRMETGCNTSMIINTLLWEWLWSFQIYHDLITMIILQLWLQPRWTLGHINQATCNPTVLSFTLMLAIWSVLCSCYNSNCGWQTFPTVLKDHAWCLGDVWLVSDSENFNCSDSWLSKVGKVIIWRRWVFAKYRVIQSMLRPWILTQILPTRVLDGVGNLMHSPYFGVGILHFPYLQIMWLKQ